MTTGEEMRDLATRIAKARIRHLKEIHAAYMFLTQVIDDAFLVLTDAERDSLKEWGNVNWALLDEIDDDARDT